MLTTIRMSKDDASSGLDGAHAYQRTVELLLKVVLKTHNALWRCGDAEFEVLATMQGIVERVGLPSRRDLSRLLGHGDMDGIELRPHAPGFTDITQIAR